MKITWYGHAAFAIEGRNDAGEDVKIILDPYNFPDCGGYLAIDESADTVCVSHENRKYHSDTSAIQGDFELLEALMFAGGTRVSNGVTFSSIEVYEDDEGTGPNAMVKFTLEGITIGHQGDLGHRLEGEALKFLRDVDVLLALTGGDPTIDLHHLREAILAVKTPLVLPMHYKTPKVNLDLLPIDAFLEECDGWTVDQPGSSTLEITKDDVPSETRVIVLDHAR